MTNAELINNMRACIRLGVLIDDCDITDDCHYSEDGECGDCMLRMVNDAADALEAAEKRIEELMPKGGEWEERYIEDANPMFRRRFYCSRCGDWTTYGKTRYCPNCGAIMDGKEIVDG